MKAACIITSVCILFSFGCELPQKVEKRKKLVIVLCDVSASTTQYHLKNASDGRLGKLKYYVEKIPRWEIYPLESQIHYYPVSNNLLSPPVGEVAYNIKLKSQLNKEIKKVDSTLAVIQSQLDILALKNMQSSCIQLSIKRVIRRFWELVDDTYDNELIIVSDMLECCGGVKMDGSNLNNAKALQGAIARFETSNTDVDATSLNLNIKVIINTPEMGENYELVEAGWRRWFSKIGVESSNVVFYTDDPKIPGNPYLDKF